MVVQYLYSKPRHHWRYADITGSFCQEGRLNWIKQGTRTCAIIVRHEWNSSLPSVSCCWWPFSSTISHLLSLLQSVTLLACSFHASPCMPAVVLDYIVFKVLYSKSKNVFFIFRVCCLCIIFCDKYYKPIPVQYCIADCVSQVPGLTLLDLWTNGTFKRTLRMELIHMFPVRGLTILGFSWFSDIVIGAEGWKRDWLRQAQSETSLHEQWLHRRDSKQTPQLLRNRVFLLRLGGCDLFRLG